MNDKIKELSANARAALAGVQGLAFLIVVLAVAFCDVAFIWMFHNVFPDGIFRIASYIGVFATTLSVVGLFLGKTLWFRPGAQIITAWLFAAIEGAVIIVNTVAAFSVARAGGNIDTNLQMWITYVSPATPVIAAAGWFLISWFSPERAMAHKRMEMEDKIAEEEIAFELETGRARIALQREYLKAGRAYMHEEMGAEHIQRQIKQTAANSMADVLGRMTGQYIVPRHITSIEDEISARANATNGHKAASKN